MALAERSNLRWVAAAAGVALLLLPLDRVSRRAVENSGTASVVIVDPPDGFAVGGNVVELSVRAGGVLIAAPDGSAETAHFHVFVDRDPVAPGAVIPKTRGIVHATSSTILVPGLSLGEHRFVVVLGDGAHRRIGTGAPEVRVSVTGPVLTANAPATSVEGEPWTVKVGVQGVRIVKADGDTSGSTGHFHFFIDREPPSEGAEIALDAEGVVHTTSQAVPLTGLEAGDHTVWVVLGDGTHRAFTPLVADRVTVTISPPS